MILLLQTWKTPCFERIAHFRSRKLKVFYFTWGSCMQKNHRKLHEYMIQTDHTESTEGKYRPPFLPIIVFGICFQLH